MDERKAQLQIAQLRDKLERALDDVEERKEENRRWVSEVIALRDRAEAADRALERAKAWFGEHAWEEMESAGPRRGSLGSVDAAEALRHLAGFAEGFEMVTKAIEELGEKLDALKEERSQ